MGGIQGGHIWEGPVFISWGLPVQVGLTPMILVGWGWIRASGPCWGAYLFLFSLSLCVSLSHGRNEQINLKRAYDKVREMVRGRNKFGQDSLSETSGASTRDLQNVHGKRVSWKSIPGAYPEMDTVLRLWNIGFLEQKWRSSAETSPSRLISSG